MLAPFLAVALVGSPAELEWDAPAGCPSAAEVNRRVQRLVGDEDLEPARVSARLWKAETGKTWRLSLRVDAEGTREIEADDCEALADAAVVMIGMGLNAAVEGEAEGASRVPLPPPVPAAADDASDAPVSPRLDPGEAGRGVRPEPPTGSRAPVSSAKTDAEGAPPRRWRSPRVVLGIMTGAHGAGLPAPGAQIGGRVGVRWGPLRLAAVGAHWFRRTQRVVDDVSASYTLSTGGLELCGVLPWGRQVAAFEGIGCGAIEVGRLEARARGASNPRQPRHLWVAPGVGVGALWTPRSVIAVGVRADVFAPTRRQRFVVGAETAGTVGQVDARGTLVVEVRIPSFSPSA